jgi:hypothetical protein
MHCFESFEKCASWIEDHVGQEDLKYRKNGHSNPIKKEAVIV